MTPHEEKFDELAKNLGIGNLVACLIRFKMPEPKAMFKLMQADPHLNNVPLHNWDEAAGRIFSHRPIKCPTCGQHWQKQIPINHMELDHEPPFDVRIARGLSLSERVCVLKHVAKFYYAQEC